MGVEFTNIVEMAPGTDIWVIEGTDAEGNPTGHFFHKEALEWRSVEYGVDKDDIDTLFDIIFNEALTSHLSLVDPGIVAGHPYPYGIPEAEAWAAKQNHMQIVKAAQSGALLRASLTVSVDRLELGQALAGMMTPLDGLRLEEKKLVRAVNIPNHLRPRAEKLFKEPGNSINTVAEAVQQAEILLAVEEIEKAEAKSAKVEQVKSDLITAARSLTLGCLLPDTGDLP